MKDGDEEDEEERRRRKNQAAIWGGEDQAFKCEMENGNFSERVKRTG